jgi:hypothetical protein
MLNAADVPKIGPSTAKKAQNAGDGPKNGTSTALYCYLCENSILWE